MAKIPYNSQKEMQSDGMYNSYDTWYGSPYPPVEKLHTPITPEENILRYYRGEEYEWIPDINSDQIELSPHCIPDNDAQDFEGGYDAFGVKWIPANGDSELPSFVEPGFQLLDDICDWRTLTIPDVESWPWEKAKKEAMIALDGDNRLRRGAIMSGYFERLISIMTFEEAAVAIISEPDEVREFFEVLTDINIAVADHYIDDFGCKSIKIHDDWSAQRAPFFSPALAEEVIGPPMKRLIDHIHERGCIFVLHSCGNGTKFVPLWKKLHVDSWQLQCNAVNMEEALEAAGDDIILEPYPDIPEGIHGMELKAFLKKSLEEYCSKYRCMVMFTDWDPERLSETRKLCYEVGRELALEGNCK